MALKLKLLATANDGRLWLAINGVQYLYWLDAAHHRRIEHLIRRGFNGTALGLVKCVARNYEKIGG